MTKQRLETDIFLMAGLHSHAIKNKNRNHSLN